MRLALYHVGTKVFEASTDILPPRGSRLIFENQAVGVDVPLGVRAVASVVPQQPPLELDYCRGAEVVINILIDDFQELIPD